MINNLILIGRRVDEKEMKYFAKTGKAYLNFTIAVERDYKRETEEGEKEKITDFFNLTAYGHTATYLANYLEKGKLVSIQGRIENNHYEKEDGEMVYNNAIIVEKAQVLQFEKKVEAEPQKKTSTKSKK